MSVKETGQRVLKARPSLFVQAEPVTKGYLVKPAFQEEKGKTVKKSLKEHSEGGLKGGNHCGEVKLTILTRKENNNTKPSGLSAKHLPGSSSFRC